MLLSLFIRVFTLFVKFYIYSKWTIIHPWLRGKILVVGLANKYSIAAAIATSLHENGAILGFSYQNDRFEKFINEFSAENGQGFTKFAIYQTMRTSNSL